MSTPSTTALGRLLEAANEGGGKEVVMQSDQVPYLVSSGNQSALGDVTSSGQLFEMLSEVLTDEQQVDLAVGNIVEFTLTVGGVGWHLLTEPGVDGVSVRGRVSGGMSAEGRPGKSVQLPAVESSVGFGTGQFEADDLPPPLDDELEIALEEVPDVDDAFSADAFSPATPGAPTPAASPDRDASVDFGFAASPDAASAPADPFAAGPDPFDDDPFGGLEAPRSSTRNVPTVEEPAAADASASDVGIPADDDEPPPVLDDDEFTADFAFVGPGEPRAAAQTPEKSAGKDRSEASTSAATLMRIPATGENETAADEASVASSSEDAREEGEQIVDDAAAPRPETDAAMPRRRPSSGATVRISAAEAANEMARQLARQSSTREIERQEARRMAGELGARASWGEQLRASTLADLAEHVPEGSLVHVLGAGAMDMVGSADALCFLEGDEPGMNADATEGRPAGTWVVLSLDDPSPWLGWILRRLEEGHRVLVETRARTTEGAWRTLLGLGAGPRAESWIAAHEHLAAVESDGEWTLSRRG